MCFTLPPPTCSECGEPLTMEMECDSGICVDCAAEAALRPTPEQLGLQPLFPSREVI